MSSEKASNSPGLCHVKGQKPNLGTQTGSQNQFSSLFLGVTKTSFWDVTQRILVVIERPFGSASPRLIDS
jgi:hypothetical protein